YFHELDSTLYTVTSESFIGQIYGLFGVENIADSASDAGAYPQLQSAYAVSADPDLIFLADAQRGGASPESVAQRPGWSAITPVRAGQERTLNGDVSGAWGPRRGELARDIADIPAGRKGP